MVLSHLHFDHSGGLHQIPNATLVVQRREWEAGFDREVAASYFLPRRYFDLGHKVQLIDGEHDLFGDGSAVCVPSIGHTPGHQSLRVRNAQGDHILVGDACYNCEVVETRAFPAFADHAAMNRSLDALLALGGPETVMVFGHDPGAVGRDAGVAEREGLEVDAHDAHREQRHADAVDRDRPDRDDVQRHSDEVGGRGRAVAGRVDEVADGHRKGDRRGPEEAIDLSDPSGLE